MSKIAQVLLSDIRKFENIETELPELKEDEVLVTVKNCGICGSDFHAYTGEMPFMKPRWSWGMSFQVSSIKSAPVSGELNRGQSDGRTFTCLS